MISRSDMRILTLIIAITLLSGSIIQTMASFKKLLDLAALMLVLKLQPGYKGKGGGHHHHHHSSYGDDDEHDGDHHEMLHYPIKEMAKAAKLAGFKIPWKLKERKPKKLNFVVSYTKGDYKRKFRYKSAKKNNDEYK